MKIEYEKDNDCVGCEYCVHCGRGWYRYAVAIHCDNCDEVVDEVYESEWGDLCAGCLLEHYDKITLEDIDEDR